VKLATIRTAGGTRAVRVDDSEAVVLPAADVGAVLARDGWRGWAEAADGARIPLAELDYAPLVVGPDKVVCVGLNYRTHIEETGRDAPTHPTLFAKFRSALTGATDDIVLPQESARCDYEAELAVIIGRRGRRIPLGQAANHIAGYTNINDFSMRDWQLRTSQFLQGKTWEACTPLGPWLVTADESPGPSRELTCEVNGATRQKADTAQLLFGPEDLVSYVSTFATVEPGDVIATGTPAGVGAATGVWLGDGDVLVTRIEGLGECRNVCRRPDRAS
jgi:acylpyruvate hydrolase